MHSKVPTVYNLTSRLNGEQELFTFDLHALKATTMVQTVPPVLARSLTA